MHICPPAWLISGPPRPLFACAMPYSQSSLRQSKSQGTTSVLTSIVSGSIMDRNPNQRNKADAMRLVIGIATRGRPAILIETISDLARQQRLPDEIIVAYADNIDIGDAPERFPEVRFLRSPLGLTRQRNVIMDSCNDSDILLFIDDDFYLEAAYLEIIERLFVEHPEVAAATGNVVADGIQGPGLAVEEAKSILFKLNAVEQKQKITTAFNTYGCNMSFRLAPVREHGLRFDERLPLYGWCEDVDFSRQLAPYGSIVRSSTAYGVHLGIKSGRTSGVRLGYSQIANPIYLARKGSISWHSAFASAFRRCAKNMLKSLVPEAYVDRRGRLLGNLVACQHLLGGKLCPSKITTL
jgi:GT2 family glycosyltransferase